MPVAVVNPRQVHDLVKGTGRLAKTDAQEMDAMTTRANQVMTMLVAKKNRLSRSIPSVRSSIRSRVAWLERGSKTRATDCDRCCATVQCGGKWATCCVQLPAWESSCCCPYPRSYRNRAG